MFPRARSPRLLTWAVRGQASVNPKAETVEELQRRRKALHMGMCKLLREDLSILAEQRAAKNDDKVQRCPRLGSLLIVHVGALDTR